MYSGYAIPINQALPIARQIAAGRPANGNVQIGWPAFLGVLLPSSPSSDPRQQDSQELRRDDGVSGQGRGCTTGDAPAAPARVAPVRTGALVDGVLCGTPAAQTGISTGDVITSVEGQEITSPGSLTALLRRYHPGSMVPVDWTAPDGSPHSALVTLAAGPAG